MLFSQEYNITRTDEQDWFDPMLHQDTKLFIDPFLVFESDLVLFRNTQEKFLGFFEKAFELGFETKGSKEHLAYPKLKKLLTFPEVPELCLGYSDRNTSGSGTGGGFAEIFADAILESISFGKEGFAHFEEVEIFTSGIGKDRISDVTANILKNELIEYTQSICKELDIRLDLFYVRNLGFNPKRKKWIPDGLVRLPRNPFRLKQGIILVPADFLGVRHAIGTEQFIDYIWENKNEEIRIEVNYFVKKNLKDNEVVKDILRKKECSVSIAKRHPEWVSEYIDYVEYEKKVVPYNLEKDKLGRYKPFKNLAEKIAERTANFLKEHPLSLSVSNPSEFNQAVETMIEQYRIFIEENGGWELLWNEKRSLEETEDVPLNTDEEASLKEDNSKIYENSLLEKTNLDINEESSLEEVNSEVSNVSEELSTSEAAKEPSYCEDDLEVNKKASKKKIAKEKKEIRIPRKESAAQLTFVSVVRSYCKSNNIDLTREANIGRGPVDFKFSSGYSNRALLEVKLASSQKLEQGIRKQLPAYLKAEQVNYGYYLIVVYRNEEFGRVEQVRALLNTLEEELNVNLKIYVVDARLDKTSASKL